MAGNLFSIHYHSSPRERPEGSLPGLSIRSGPEVIYTWSRAPVSTETHTTSTHLQPVAFKKQASNPIPTRSVGQGKGNHGADPNQIRIVSNIRSAASSATLEVEGGGEGLDGSYPA